MIALSLAFQRHSVLSKMAASLSKTIGNQNRTELPPLYLDFQWFGFGMVGTIAIGIAMTNQNQTIGNPNFKAYGIPMCLVFQPPLYDLNAKAIVIPDTQISESSGKSGFRMVESKMVH